MEKRSLLSSKARVQAPWIKVTIGKYSFGVFDKKTKANTKDVNGFYTTYNVQYPNYIQRLSITKINGQVNQYELQLTYPVRSTDDPNFFEKVLSSVSSTRKIIFSYGDASMPTYIYKDEEALITGVTQSFNLEASTISYTIKAVSSSVMGQTGAFTFIYSGRHKPSDIIKDLFNNPTYGLGNLFKGMNESNLKTLIAGDDREVELTAKTNISPLDYINYLVGCMIPEGSTANNLSKDMYILTIHDDTVYDKLYSDSESLGGPYFKVTRTSSSIKHADAYEVDIGINTSTIVTQFNIVNNENFSLYYDYSSELYPETYTRYLNDKGQWEEIYAPMATSKNDNYRTRPEDVIWFTKVTNYPIAATIKIQGLLRPAHLMQYLRLNVVFPGGNKHISSGLYIVTKQIDEISESGYFTTLSLTRISS